MATGADINVKIALDGEKDYRQALKNCNDALKNAKSSLKLFDEESKGNANTLKTLQERESKLNTILAEATKKQETLTTAVENAKKRREEAAKAVEEARKAYGNESKEVQNAEKAYLSADNAVNRYEKQLNDAKTETTKINAEIKQNTKYIEEAEKADDKCAKSIDEYGKEVKEAAESTGDLNKVVGNLTAMEALTKIADKVSSAMSKVNTAMADAATEIESGLTQITKRTGSSGKELEKYQKIAKDAFGSMPVDIDQASDAVGELATRFSDLSDKQLSKLSKSFLQFAQINGTDVANAIDTTQKAMAAFGVSVEDAETVLDVFNRTGQNTGVDVASLASTISSNAEAFQQLGMDIYQASDFLGQLEVSGADSSAVMMGLKTALKEAADEGEPLNEALAKLQDAVVNGTDSMDGLSYAYEVFGTRSGAQVYNAIKNGTIDFQNLTETTDILADATGNLNETYENTLTLADKYTVAQNNLKIAAEELQGEFNKALAPALEALSDVVKDATSVFQELPEEVQTVVGVIATLGSKALEVAPQIASLITQLTTLKIAKAAAGMSNLGDAASTAGTSLGSFGKAALGVGAGIGVFGTLMAWGQSKVDAWNASIAAGASEETALKEQIDATGAAIEEMAASAYDANTAQAFLNEALQEQEAAQSALALANKDLEAFYEKYPALLDESIDVGDNFVDSLGYTQTYTKELSGELKTLKLRVTESEEAVEDATDVTEKASKAMESTAETVDDFADAETAAAKATEKANALMQTSTYKAMQQVATSVNGVKDALTQGAQSITNWFDAVSEQEAKSADEMAKNLQDQIDSMKNWEENLIFLANSGINEGLLQYLADMGPTGAAYVQAFVDAANGKTEVGIDEMNRLWMEKLDLESGVNAEAKDLYNAVGVMVAGTESQLKYLSNTANKSGAAIPEEVASGVNAAAYKSTNAVNSMVSSAKAALNSTNAYSSAYNIGKNISLGVANGIAAWAYTAYNAAGNMTSTIISRSQSLLQIQSPSRVFAEIGRYVDLGLAQGINKYAYTASDAVASMSGNLAKDMSIPDLSGYHDSNLINNQVTIMLGDKELTGVMLNGVVKGISSNQRASLAAAGGL